MVKYPEVEVSLSGSSGNAFMVMGKVRQAMRRAGVPAAEIEVFSREAMGGDYSHLLVVCDNWVTVV